MIGILPREEEKENALDIFTFHSIQEVLHASKLSIYAKLQLL